MAYHVVLADSAKADANQIYDSIVERAPVRGPEWFEELIDCLYSLEELPYRCPLAREAKRAKCEIPLSPVRETAKRLLTRHFLHLRARRPAFSAAVRPTGHSCH